MTIASLGYLGFDVTDTDGWDGFAGSVLGLMAVPAGADPDAHWYRWDDRPFRIATHRAGRDGLAYIGLDAGSKASFDRTAATLIAAGVPATLAGSDLRTARRVAEVLITEDPAGNRVEIIHTPVLDHDPVASPTGVSGFVTGEGGLGHLVLLVSPYDEVRHFYTEVLGFHESDRMHLGPTLVEFLHCNPRHHSLALGDGGGANLVLHFMVEMATLDDVGYALDRARDAGATITMGLGRHANDRMTSFYVQTPSGFEVEVGTGGLLLDDATWSVAEISRTSLWGHRPEGAPAPAPAPDQMAVVPPSVTSSRPLT